MKTFQVKGLLQQTGWHLNQYITLDVGGTIIDISNNGEASEYINGYVIPGFQNSHSHAFQYAMAGLAEIHPINSHKDDFWSWREAMYQVALSVDPDQLEGIATMLYAEMLRKGYTSVAEFHYLHHDKKGRPYDHLSELGERLISAAAKAGINITLIPVFYHNGGFGKTFEPNQKRFISPDADAYFKLLEASQKSVLHYENARIGFGIHSLRAAAEKDIKKILAEGPKQYPFHMHLAEQLKEIDDCVSFYGQRPAEWLLDNCAVSDRFHLIHCTHLTTEESTRLAASGAHAVLCPSTEGNLGDGIFSLSLFQSKGGKWSIGTDSQIGLNPLEEFKILDYVQRVSTHYRAQFTSEVEGDSGYYALDMAFRSGKKAIGVKVVDYFEMGTPFDGVVIDANTPLIAVSKPENILATLFYSGHPSDFLGTIIAGKWVVKNQRHIHQDPIQNEFELTMKTLNLR
ncbi:MAG: formimidoylglutamate deiminase [Flammeovirgaceae bacterium]|jgi:formimidoylglutamate deiminase|nr:formimidoylglutamate deiminase [Flammeovirgaceae bacterium]|tara:strand:+ start:8259 stop:9629 length:1371 start_codon:yes stop_codon:yes gene_type:complete